MKRIGICFIVLFVLVVTSVCADVVYFKNDQEIEGVVQEETETHVIIDVGAGNFTFSKDEIARIEKGSSMSEAQKKRTPQEDRLQSEGAQLNVLLNKVRIKRGLVSRFNQKRMITEKKRAKSEEALIPLYREFEKINEKASEIDWGGKGSAKDRKESFSVSSRYNSLMSQIREYETQMNQDRRDLRDVGAELSKSMNELSQLVSALDKQYMALLRKDPTGELEKKFSHVGKMIERYNADWLREDIPVRQEGTSYYVDARLNGTAMYPFLIDTGASTVVISRSIADALQIRKEDEIKTIQCKIANGKTVDGRLVMLESIQIGAMRAEKVPTIIIDDSANDVEVNSLLGMTFLQQFYFQIDTRGQKLILKQFEG